jgi:hypothetical protein
MRKVFFFQYDIKPEHRQQYERYRQIDVIIEWKGGTYSTDGRPIVYVSFPSIDVSDLCIVTDWRAVVNECEKIGEAHFAEAAKEEKIKRARAVLNEFENPILERMAEPAY